MFRSSRSWRSGTAGLFFGLALAWPSARAESPAPSLPSQLVNLGRQALAQGAAPTAQTFFQKALQLDPTNKAAARGLEESKRVAGAIVRVALQGPADAQPATGDSSPIPGRPSSRARRPRISPGSN